MGKKDSADGDQPIDVSPPMPSQDAPAPAVAPEKPLAPRQLAEKAHQDRIAGLQKQEADKKKFHADLRAHLVEANQEERNDNAPLHPHVHAHAALRGFSPVKVIDPETMKPVDRPCWQMQALVARFHAHGLRHDSRISPEMFEKALDEALNGRV